LQNDQFFLQKKDEFFFGSNPIANAILGAVVEFPVPFVVLLRQLLDGGRQGSQRLQEEDTGGETVRVEVFQEVFSDGVVAPDKEVIHPVQHVIADLTYDFRRNTAGGLEQPVEDLLLFHVPLLQTPVGDLQEGGIVQLVPAVVEEVEILLHIGVDFHALPFEIAKCLVDMTIDDQLIYQRC